MSMADRGARLLRDKIATAFGREVQYTRGTTTVTITVSPAAGRSLANPAAANVLSVRTESTERDYLIPATEYTRVSLGTPQRGDRITEVIDGVACVFECAPREQEPEWRWSNDERIVYRLHCKQVA